MNLKVIENYMTNELKIIIKKKSTGRPPTRPRRIAQKIIFYLRTGCTWRLIGKRWNTVYGWFKRLTAARFFEQLWNKVRAILLRVKEIERVIVDGSLAFAHGGELAQNNGRNRGKKSINRVLEADQDGLPLELLLAAGKTPDMRQLIPLLDRMKNILPREFYVHADKGFDSEDNRVEIAKRGGIPKIPFRHFSTKTPVKIQKDEHRWKIERTFAWINAFKSLRIITTRTTELIESLFYLAMASIVLNAIDKRRLYSAELGTK